MSETPAALAEAWRAHLAEGRRRSLHTVRAYVATAERLLRWMEEMDGRAPDRAALARLTTGAFSAVPPIDPWKRASPKLNTPPSSANSQYPSLAAPAGAAEPATNPPARASAVTAMATERRSRAKRGVTEFPLR